MSLPIFGYEWLSLLWRASWQAGYIYLAVAAITFLLRRRIAPAWQFLLWSLVVFRMIFVVTPQSPWSVFNLVDNRIAPSRLSEFDFLEARSPILESESIESAEFNISPKNTELIATAEVPGSMRNETSFALNEVEVNPITPASESLAENVPSRSNLYSMVFIVWLVAFLISLSTLVAGWVALRKNLSRFILTNDVRLLTLLDQARVQWRCRTRPQLYIANETISPFVVGVLWPRIVLPASVANEMSDDEVKCILAHELAHVRRRDILVQWVTLVVRAVYWFHPCVWLVLRHMRMCREAACDDFVSSDLNADQRRQYGLAILRLIGNAKPLRYASCLCGLFGVKNSIQYRIQRLATTPKFSPMWNVLSGVLLLVAAVVGFTDSVVGVQTATTDPPNLVNQLDTNKQPQQNEQKAITGPLAFEGTCISWEEESPVPGVELTLFEVVGAREEVRELRRTTSDLDGKYSLGNFPSTNQSQTARRHYLVKAVREGYPDVLYPRDQDFDTLGWGGNIRMHRGTGDIKGRVTDEKGNPIVGATVQRAFSVRASDVGVSSATTDKDGLFILGGMPLIDGKPSSFRGAYLQIYHPDYAMNGFERKSLAHSTFVLVNGCVVEGSVIDELTKEPRILTTVRAIRADTEFDGHEDKATTDSNGRFRMVLAEGNYNLILEDPSYVAKSSYLECRKGGALKLDPIRAIAGGWIIGQVINTDTNQPTVFNEDPNWHNATVGVGLYGPDRPIGKIRYTHSLDEVDEEGRFRMRAYPGENFPYLCNLTGDRTPFTTLEQPPVIVEAGKETTYNLTFQPPRSPEQKMEKARPVLDKLSEEQDERIEGIIAEFRKLNDTVDECETWCLLMQTIVQIGKPAVPALCKELESTESPGMMRRIAFALRAIGDPRAVPTLIRVLPKTLLPPLNDYGLFVDDPELMKFMQANDLREDQDKYFGFGRPVREVYGALNKLTNRKQNELPLSSMSRQKDLQSLARQEKIYDAAARAWVTWWENNWQLFGVGQEYSRVNLPEFKPQDLSGYPTGLELTENATAENVWSQVILSPVGSSENDAIFFIDLDTRRYAGWPKSLPAQDDSEQSVQAAREFASKRGYDLMCLAQTNAKGAVAYALVGIEMQLWEIDWYEAKKLGDFVKMGKLPLGRRLDTDFIFHRDAESKRDVSAINSSFLYLTKDQGLGVIDLTDFVTDVQNTAGSFLRPSKGVGPHFGVRLNHRAVAR